MKTDPASSGRKGRKGRITSHAPYLSCAMNELETERLSMVEHDLLRRGVRSEAVLDAMRRVPRHRFVPEALRTQAYSDSPLPIGEQQTISQPFIVALMVQAAQLSRYDRVLEIGTGSGYGAAVLATIAAHVDTIERLASLANHARDTLAELGYLNVDVHVADGTLGLPERAPFDAIITTAASPDIPDGFKAQLGVGGRLIIPVGPQREHQTLIRITRRTESRFETQDLCSVQFVPLIGAYGWQTD